MKNTNVIFTTILLVLFVYATANAQSSDYVLDKQEQERTIDSIGSQLKANYIFPKLAEEMHQLIVGKLKNNQYKSITDPNEFSNRLTNDLQSISKDLHLRVIYAPEQIAETNNAITDEDQLILKKQAIEEMKRENFGFQEVKILGGNIGYLDLRAFFPPAYGGETAVATMNFLSNADALIIDLRQNGGGSPGMIQLISSYLFDSEPVHLNNFYWRPRDEHTQTWTLPHVQGKRRPDVEVYILTSKGTFSAAEEFSYNLKNLGRATLIGETTGGGAHPGGTVNVTDKFMVWIPQGRAINPITNTNWEGTGVVPHIEVSAENALVRAQIEAFEKLIKNTKDNTKANFHSWHLKGIKTKTYPIELDQKSLKDYVGTYGPRIIMIENGQLIYQREGHAKHILIPMGDSWFMLEGLDNFRIEFIKENMDVIALIGHYEDGNTDKSPKNSLKN